jgi:plastocyanin
MDNKTPRTTIKSEREQERIKPMQHKPTRWFPILGILVLILAVAACGGSASQSDDAPANPRADIAQQGEGAKGGGTTVNVVAKDMRFALRPKGVSQASAGAITFVVTNDDPMPHDFAIEVNGAEHKTAMIDAGKTESLTVDLEPGTYQYRCTVTGHSLAGMRGTFTITGS